MHGQIRPAKAMPAMSLSSPRVDALWECLERHWYAVVAGISVTVAGVLLVTSAIPPLLAPIVLGPLGAVAMTALLAPKCERDHDASRHDTDRRRV